MAHVCDGDENWEYREVSDLVVIFSCMTTTLISTVLKFFNYFMQSSNQLYEICTIIFPTLQQKVKLSKMK